MIPAMVFLGIVMMPFYSKVRSVPEYLRLRFNDPTHVLNSLSFAVATVLIAGVNLSQGRHHPVRPPHGDRRPPGPVRRDPDDHGAVRLRRRHRQGRRHQHHLWAGLVIVAGGAVFVAWVVLRPLRVEDLRGADDDRGEGE